jgi:tripartite-type tricarboxylate transporter receptor subunit TctC
MGAPASSQSVASFYKGRQITLVVGTTAANPWAGLLERHLGRKMPGNPSIKSTPNVGAAGFLAANHLLNRAPKDGSTIALVPGRMLFDSATGIAPSSVDVRKLVWLGSIGSQTSVIVAWHTSPIKSTEDLFKQEMLVAGSGCATPSEMTPLLLNALIGTKFRRKEPWRSEPVAQVVSAMERGNIMGFSWTWEEIKAGYMHWLNEGKIRLLMQSARSKHPDLPKAALALDYAKSPADRTLLELLEADRAFAFPIAAPPGVPADRIQALRNALLALKADSAFIADSRKLRIDATVTPHPDVEKLSAYLHNTPKATIDRLLAQLRSQYWASCVIN